MDYATLIRFMAKVEWPDNRERDCWQWTGAINGSGYGNFAWDTRRIIDGQRVERRPYRGAHRVSYEFFVGPIPSGMQLDHLCRNRSCVNPAHLEIVTNAENVAA